MYMSNESFTNRREDAITDRRADAARKDAVRKDAVRKDAARKDAARKDAARKGAARKGRRCTKEQTLYAVPGSIYICNLQKDLSSCNQSKPELRWSTLKHTVQFRHKEVVRRTCSIFPVPVLPSQFRVRSSGSQGREP